MSALQSGHLSPRWYTVSAHYSQKRWCHVHRGENYDWSNTLRSSRRMPLLRVQTLLQHPVLIAWAYFHRHC